MVTGYVPSLITMVKCLVRMFAASGSVTLQSLELFCTPAPVPAVLDNMDDSSVSPDHDNSFAISMHHDPTRGWTISIGRMKAWRARAAPRFSGSAGRIPLECMASEPQTIAYLLPNNQP
jgi:hypothetical protein